MVNTVKFSQFSTINLSGTNSLVGLSDGANAISDLPIHWTTATRPGSQFPFVAPVDGMAGYNTSLHIWEFWNDSTLTWEPVGGGGSGSVTQVDTGTGLTGGPITASGTISFAPIAANSFWANTTGGVAVPTVTSLSDFLLASQNLADLPNKPLARSNLGVAIGTNVEAWSAILDQIAAGVWTGATSITTLGTITTGLWHGSTVTVPFGGTGNTTFTAYSVICAGTSSTGPFQNVSGLGSAGQVLTSNGAGGLPTWQSTSGTGTVNPGLINQLAYYAASGTVVSGLPTGNDGVLITSGGGAPSISSTLPLLVQTNITELGTITVGVWEGTNIALDHGGTNASLVASNGGIFYSDATGGAILSGTATANQVLLSGASSAPSWSTATYPASTSINRILYSSAANTISEIASLANATLVTDGTGVPSISATLPSQVQLNITSLGTVTTGVWNASTITVPFGGTGNTTFTAYSVICAGTTATGPFQNVVGVGASGQVLTSNGAAALPTWQNVSGTGTVNSGLINQVAYYAANGNTISGLATANGGVLVTSNAGAPSILAGSGTTGTVLQATNAGTPAWSSATYPLTTTINQLLYSSAANTITGLATANGGTLVTSNTGVPSILAGSGTTGTVLQATAAGTPAWSTATYPLSTTVNRILYSSSSNVVGQITTANSGVLVTSGAGVPSILAAGTTGQVLQASTAGTPAWSTATYPATTTANQLLYSSAANAVSELTTANSGLLVTSNTGVPSILAGPGTTGNMLLSNAAAAPSFSTSTIPSSAGATANKVLLSDGTNYVLSTPTFPNASATSRKIIVSDGTNWVASTETWAVPGTSGNVLTSNGTNWTSAAPSGTSVVVKRVSTQTGAVATGTTVMPLDDTIPQNTEGDQYMSLAITPGNTNNILQIVVTAMFSSSAASQTVGIALFQDSTAGALAAVGDRLASSTVMNTCSWTHTMTAGTTSSTTFKVRMGNNQSTNTLTFNGVSAGRIYGGVAASSIVITEFTP